MTRDTTSTTLNRVLASSHTLKLLSIGVLTIGAALSVLAWHKTAAHLERMSDDQLDQAITSSAEQLREEMSQHTHLLTGLQILFRATDTVSRKDFHDHYKTLQAGTNYPGLVAVHFAPLVTREQKAAFEASVRQDTSLEAQGYPRFAIYPAGDRPEYLPAAYMEPMQGNESALGHDGRDGAERIDAQERARDSGRATASAPLVLMQGGGTGFVVRMPVYRHGRPLDTTAQRRSAYLGQLSAVIRAHDLFDGLLKPGLFNDYRLRVRDLGPSALQASDKPAAPTPLFDSGARSGTVVSQADASSPQNARSHIIDLAGRMWELTLMRPPSNFALQPLPLALLLGGLLSSLGAAAALWSLSRGYQQAGELARHLSETARESQSRLQSVINHTVDGIVTLSPGGDVLSVNTAMCRIFSRKEVELVGCPAERLLPDLADTPRDVDQAPCEAWIARWSLATPREMRGADATGRLFPLDLSLSEMVCDGERQFVGIVRDLRERKAQVAAIEATRRQLNEVDEMRRVIVQHAPYAIVVVNRRGLVLSMNPAAESLLGWSAQEIVGRQTSLLFHDPEDIQLRSEQLSARHGRTIRGMEVFGMYAAEDGRMSPSEWTLVRKDGRKLIAEINVNPLRNENEEVTCYLAMAHDVTERRRAEDRLQHLALHDALTGLPNRAMLQEQLKQALVMAQRGGHSCALMFLDLDRFKKINDTLGHQVGDKVLIEVAQRLRDGLRQSDIVARLGGDEFVVLLQRLATPDDVQAVSAKLLAQFRDPLHIGQHELRVTPSIGVAVYPEHGPDVSTLMRHADQAMYRAKTSGRNGVQVFSADLDHATLETLELENDLYRALERDELLLHYQPQFDCATGRLAGAEALMRWKRGGAKLVSPADFIPIAEDTGLIIEMGDWALRTACKAAKHWRDMGHKLRIGVNLSALQLEQPDMVQRVADILHETNLPPQALELEITESVLVRESIRAAETLSALRHLGISVAIDDFGVGYSSFAYLRELPIDRLKIDRSFLASLPHSAGDARLTAALIAMAQRLEVGVVAEGVENDAQYAFLKQHGCDEAQGYHLGRPMPQEAFEDLLRAQPQTESQTVPA